MVVKRRTKIQRWLLGPSTTEHNELPQLELQWALRNSQKEDEVVALGTTKDPKLVFLMETKVDKPTLERVGRTIHFTNLFFVPHVNSGGGLALYWKSNFDVDVQSFSNHHIDAFINHGVDDAWRFIGFYGDPDTASRENSWSLL